MNTICLRKSLVNGSFALAWLLGGTLVFASPTKAQGTNPSVTTSGFPSFSDARREDYEWRQRTWKRARHHFEWCWDNTFTDEHGREFYVCYPRRPYEDDNRR